MPEIYNDTVLDLILTDLDARSVKQAYQSLSGYAAPLSNVPGHKLLDLLMDREAQASSGIGGGLAIPHLKIRGLKAPVTVLARLREPIEFKAVDGQYVDIICVLLSPEREGALHLRRLSRLTRTLKDPDFLDQLRKAESKGDIRALFTDPEGWLIAA